MNNAITTRLQDSNRVTRRPRLSQYMRRTGGGRFREGRFLEVAKESSPRDTRIVYLVQSAPGETAAIHFPGGNRLVDKHEWDRYVVLNELDTTTEMVFTRRGAHPEKTDA